MHGCYVFIAAAAATEIAAAAAAEPAACAFFPSGASKPVLDQELPPLMSKARPATLAAVDEIHHEDPAGFSHDEELTHASSLVLMGGVRMPWIGIRTDGSSQEGPVARALRHGVRLIEAAVYDGMSQG